MKNLELPKNDKPGLFLLKTSLIRRVWPGEKSERLQVF